MTALGRTSHATLLLLALVMLWLGGYVAFAAWVATMKPDALDRPTDAVIVLTGGARRINTGLDLLANGKAPQLYISGVNQSVALKDILNLWQSGTAEKNAASCCIILDHKAQNTAQNASETRDWIRKENIHSIRVVTSSYHMPRAWLDFRHELPDIEILPYPVVSIQADLKSGRFWIVSFIEYHKTLVTVMHTGIAPFFEKGLKP